MRGQAAAPTHAERERERQTDRGTVPRITILDPYDT